MSKYQDNNGVLYLLQLLKAQFDTKVDAESGKGLSSNDFTTALLNKLNGIESQANKTTVNNTLTSTSTTDALSAAQGKALKDRIDEVEGEIAQAGGGDMLASTYDQNANGIVDNAEKLEGHAASYFAAATDLNDKLDTDGDGSDVTATFTASGTRSNISSGDTLATIFSKIAKWFGDLKTVAFSGSYNDLTNKPTIPTVTNDLTDALKANYDAAYTHSTQAHAPSNAEANVIDSISVNGTALTVTNKGVNVTVPTTVASLTDAADYAKKTDITGVYKYKGSVAAVANLPASGNTAGDVYDVQDTGMNYAWNGSAWDALGESAVAIDAITNSEIDAMFAQVFGS